MVSAMNPKQSQSTLPPFADQVRRVPAASPPDYQAHHSPMVSTKKPEQSQSTLPPFADQVRRVLAASPPAHRLDGRPSGQIISPEGKVRKFYEYISTLPPPGYGNGLHGMLLGAANFGVAANLGQEQIFNAIKTAIPSGGRQVKDTEIQSAIEKALSDGNKPGELWTPKGDTTLYDPRFRDDLILSGQNITEEALMELSIPELRECPIESHGGLLLGKIYQATEIIFIGETWDKLIGRRDQWIDTLRQGIELGPHIIPNTLKNFPAERTDGKPSERCDNSVSEMRFTMAEFDDWEINDQLAFWAAIDLPIAALIHSGGKSVHAWIRVDVSSRREWDMVVKDQLYLQRLIPLGVDPSCKNPARLSRMPGYFRAENNCWQRLLYLQPDGRRILS